MGWIYEKRWAEEPKWSLYGSIPPQKGPKGPMWSLLEAKSAPKGLNRALWGPWDPIGCVGPAHVRVRHARHVRHVRHMGPWSQAQALVPGPGPCLLVPPWALSTGPPWGPVHWAPLGLCPLVRPAALSTGPPWGPVHWSALGPCPLGPGPGGPASQKFEFWILYSNVASKNQILNFAF